jgi:hypothetical protein
MILNLVKEQERANAMTPSAKAEGFPLSGHLLTRQPYDGGQLGINFPSYLIQ